MSDVKVRVYYREPVTAPVVFLYARVDHSNPACLIISEQLTSYGDDRVTRIPWDRIAHVETEPS